MTVFKIPDPSVGDFLRFLLFNAWQCSDIMVNYWYIEM